jgi:uncharacterized membrane protein YccC
MASENTSLPSPQSFIAPSSFWSRESNAIKQGIKTGLAGTITYAIYSGWHLRQGYWAIFAALVVTQANLGASWKAALYRTIGSTCGAVAAALLFPILGKGPVGAGITLFMLASIFAYLTALHTAFTAAGFTAAIILVFGGISEPWHMAWLRVLYTALGAAVAFGVGALLWPVRAREALRQKIANIVEGGGVLYCAVTAAALEGVDNEEEVRELDRKLHDLRRGITQQMDEARSELTFTRFNQTAYSNVVDRADLIRRRLTSMAEDRSLYVHARVKPGLLPSIPKVVEQTAELFSTVAAGARETAEPIDTSGVEAALRELDENLAKLRSQKITVPFTLDRMLPFWVLVFNLREVALELKELASALPQLG